MPSSSTRVLHPGEKLTPSPSLLNGYTQTPTRASSQDALEVTPSPDEFPVNITETVTQLPESQTIILPGTIYAFQGELYGSILPKNQLQEVEYLYDRNKQIRYPKFVEYASFAQGADLMAYGTFDDNKVEIWVTDLKLTTLLYHWSDEDQWLRNNESGFIKYMQWGPKNSSLFVYSIEGFVGINLVRKTSHQLTGRCNWAGKSPKTGQWAVWCPISSQIDGSYFVFEGDGSQWTTSELPTVLANEALDFSFSPDAQKVVLADISGNLWVKDINSMEKKLGISYVEPVSDIYMRPLKWSDDGNRLLVFASNVNGQCPIDSTNLPPCWMLYDPKSGELLWPKRDQSITLSDDAELSPDGKWIVMSIMNIPARYIRLISVETGQYFYIAGWEATGLRWSD